MDLSSICQKYSPRLNRALPLHNGQCLPKLLHLSPKVSGNLETIVPRYLNGVIDLGLLGLMDSHSRRGAARAEDAQGTLTQSYISPRILLYEENELPYVLGRRT